MVKVNLPKKGYILAGGGLLLVLAGIGGYWLKSELEIFVTKPKPVFAARYLPQSCLSQSASSECQAEFDVLIRKECGGDLDAPNCVPIKKEIFDYLASKVCFGRTMSSLCRCLEGGDIDALLCDEAFFELVEPSLAAKCQQNAGLAYCGCLTAADPFQCLRQTLGQEMAVVVLCPIDTSFRQMGIPLFKSLDCTGFSPAQPSLLTNDGVGLLGCLANPGDQGCLDYFQQNCAYGGLEPLTCEKLHQYYCEADPSLYGCYEYCQNDPYTASCLTFLAQFCQENITDGLCLDVLCSYAPNACNLCLRFPLACEEVLHRVAP